MNSPMNDTTEQRLLDFINRTNWLLLAGAAAFGLFLAEEKVALGLLCGGLIAMVNFYLLHRTLKKAFGNSHLRLPSRGLIMAKYYIRFTISGLILYVLISRHVVEPLALFAGLSIVVVSIFLATLREIKKLKEVT